MNTQFTNLLETPVVELTDEELALLAQRDPSFMITTDDKDEDDVTDEAPAPTVH